MGNHHKKNIFKKVGKNIKKGSHSIGNIFEKTGKKFENTIGDVYHDITGGVSDVYGDVKGAVGYTGKHLVKDVDSLSNSLSNPLLWVAVGGVAIVVLNNR